MNRSTTSRSASFFGFADADGDFHSAYCSRGRLFGFRFRFAFTLQLLFTTLAGLLLGSRRGGMAVLVYLVLGLVGVPVFTEGGGIAYIFQPTFGYLIGFAAGAWLTGKIIETSPDGSLARYVAACLAGLAVVYGCGMAYVYVINNFYLGTPLGLWPLILYCFLLAVPGDIVLCLLAAVLGRKIRRAGML